MVKFHVVLIYFLSRIVEFGWIVNLCKSYVVEFKHKPLLKQISGTRWTVLGLGLNCHSLCFSAMEFMVFDFS